MTDEELAKRLDAVAVALKDDRPYAATSAGEAASRIRSLSAQVEAMREGLKTTYGHDSSAAPEQISTSNDRQRSGLLELDQNWDGYNANPLDHQFVAAAFEEIETEGTLVDFVPGGDGSIQAEWHLHGIVDVEYVMRKDGERNLYVSYRPVARAILAEGGENG